MIRLSLITGFTLPGMIEEPGCTAGSFSSPSPQRGPEPRKRTSLAIFVSAPLAAPIAPAKKTHASRPASCSQRLRARRSGRPVCAGEVLDRAGGELRVRPMPVPTAVPPRATSSRPS